MNQAVVGSINYASHYSSNAIDAKHLAVVKCLEVGFCRFGISLLSIKSVNQEVCQLFGANVALN